MTRRLGLTLMEILVTLVIMGLGVLAILTLFPLAASQMAIAVREDRSAQAAASADAFFRTVWKTDVEQNGAGEPYWTALNTPDTGASTAHGFTTPPNPGEWGYPVFVDPMGYFARGGRPSQFWVGDDVGPLTNIPRRTLNAANSSQAALRLCSLMDGLGYDDDGRPVNPVSNNVDRELRYNYLWVVQRSLQQNTSSANLTVVVFDRRAPLFAPPGSEAVFSNSASFTPNSTTVVVNGSPDVKPGGWVMDASVGNVSGRPLIRHANFYQVVSVTPNGANTILELQTPVKTASDNSPNQYTGTLVVLRGVSGVYARASLTGQ